MLSQFPRKLNSTQATLWILANGRILYRKTMSYFFTHTTESLNQLEDLFRTQFITNCFQFHSNFVFFNSFSSYFEWKFCSKQAVFKLFKKHIFQFELAPVAHTHKICCSRSFLLIYFFQNSHCKSDYNHQYTSSCLNSEHKSPRKYLK